MAIVRTIKLEATPQQIIPPAPKWVEASEYALADIVIEGGAYYRSKVAKNTKNTPKTSPTKWESVAGPGHAGPITWTIVNGAEAAELCDDVAGDHKVTLPAKAIVTIAAEADTLWAKGTGEIGILGMNAPVV